MPAAKTSSAGATAAATACASTAASRCPARRRRMSCRCPTRTPPPSIRRRPSSRRCRAATCSGSSTSPPGRGWCVDRYADSATGVMKKDDAGRMAMTSVVLHPAVEFSGDKLPGREEIERLHHEAHENCFIANSVKTVGPLRAGAGLRAPPRPLLRAGARGCSARGPRPSPGRRAWRRPRRASIVIVCPPRFGASKLTSSSSRSITVASRRAPMFSVRSLTS